MNPNPLPVTPYHAARHRGNTLLYLPREIRDEIYDITLAADPSPPVRFDDGNPDMDIPLLQTCRQIAHEAEPYFIKNIKFVIEDLEELRQVQKWLWSRISCDGFKTVQTVVLSSFELLRKYSHAQCYLWMRNQVYVEFEMFDLARGFRITEYETMPEAMQFLKLCTGIKNLELGIWLDNFATRMDNIDSDRSLLLPAAKTLYDLRTLYSMTSLANLTLHLECGVSDDNMRPPSVLLYELDHSKINDAWGLKSWLKKRFQANGVVIDISCNLHVNRLRLDRDAPDKEEVKIDSYIEEYIGASSLSQPKVNILTQVSQVPFIHFIVEQMLGESANKGTFPLFSESY
ncbi:hypothetical protein K505DRAFT_400806 [Melanomma pulvis-pyrius CBS 109.77]|uniref:Uncharacterized protein n=1 Tax=Melanomma pulvis-pyrius CBS 109.77 TaxID=1314802 RepID=A0A6A6XVB0_9PLEO|nr:hypothetical protein K505DRAFT_400806 [Melanomma pulvis-pyrius CBS 109.77]